MANIKLIALDLDGTLLDDNHNISDYTIQVWKRAIAAGIHVIPVTGRPLVAMLERTIPRNLCEYTINANGVHVFKIDDHREEIIWDKSISWGMAKRVIDFLNETHPDTFFHMYVGQKIHALELNERTDEYSRRTGLTYHILNSWDEIKGSSIVKIMALGEHENVLPIQKTLSSWDELTAVFSNPNYLEIFDASSSKGNAIRFLAKQLGIDVSEILGIGDAANDIPLLEACGHAYVMKNADANVAPHLERTDCTNNESGAAKHIEKMLKAVNSLY